MPTLAASGRWVCEVCTTDYPSEAAADACETDCYAGWRAAHQTWRQHTYRDHPLPDYDPED